VLPQWKKPPLPLHFLRDFRRGLSDERLFLKEKLRQQRSSIRQSGNGTGMVAFCFLSSVTGTVSISRVAN
jgi:hypothetical protein